MSNITITTKITYKYLMNKSKHDLAHMYLDLLDEMDKRISLDLDQLNLAFNHAENDTAEMFISKTCSMETKNGEHTCPICYFRKRTKQYLGFLIE